MVEFNVGQMRPVECVKQGWEIIKKQYWLFFGISLIGILIASLVPMGVLIGPMFCGIFYCLLEKMHGRKVSFQDLFKGFDFFLPSFIVSLFLLIPAAVLGILAYIPLILMQLTMLNQSNSDPNEMFVYFGIFIFLMLLIGLFIGAIHGLLLFAFPLIVEHRMSGVDAAKTSGRAVLKNLGSVGGLISIHFVMILLGNLLCFVGVYFFMPLLMASVVVAYRQVFPLPSAFQSADSYNH